MAELETIKTADNPPVSVSVPAGSLPDKPAIAVVAPEAQPVTVISTLAHHARLTDFLDAYAAPQWRLAHKLWTVRISIFWAAFGGLWVAWPAFQSFLPPFWFAVSCVGFSLTILFARLTNQPGLPG